VPFIDHTLAVPEVLSQRMSALPSPLKSPVPATCHSEPFAPAGMPNPVSAAPFSSQIAVCPVVAEVQFTAEELVIRVLQPARAQNLVRQIVHVLQDEQPRHQPGRQAGLPGPAAHMLAKRPSRNPQSISRASRTSGWPRSMMAPSAGRSRSF
jgi:hypothetical protein